MGVEGLQSIVFHGPSPIWCVASGLVWFGHPNVNKARCFTHSVINRLRQMDTNENGADTSFDWGFHDAIKRVCLQFTPRGNELYLSRAGK